jgi:hypothetical protein
MTTITAYSATTPPRLGSTENNKIQFDPNILAWIDQTKTFTDNGYNNKAILWSDEQWAGARKPTEP